ncbi:phosphonate C-P lyase system protein PhnG [Alteribacillus sp. YIM 98480]|uniref:phosphonate C-P lyase system protein PhnG n=1 Tax=Alteribacillus sp. YIM 98480 TaxID=2606599 RepID=UPI00131E971B|nr:phosphonate C-P lyase system protein PhnG [Alteribacillus sp. YIM 98480]
MKRKRLTRILVEGTDEFVESLVEEAVSEYDITIDKDPEKSLVMLKNSDSVSNQPFYSGEVLVTECSVTVEGSSGFGVVMGERPDKAFAIAVIDAIFNADLPPADRWKTRLLEEEEKIDQKHYKEAAMAARTKVNFDTMEGYDDQDD